VKTVYIPFIFVVSVIHKSTFILKQMGRFFIGELLIPRGIIRAIELRTITFVWTGAYYTHTDIKTQLWSRYIFRYIRATSTILYYTRNKVIATNIKQMGRFFIGELLIPRGIIRAIELRTITFDYNVIHNVKIVIEIKLFFIPSHVNSKSKMDLLFYTYICLSTITANIFTRLDCIYE
jgi:hypothetical protein